MDAQTITAAALEVLEDTGLEKLTMRAVADRLGVRVGGLYYHVPDKAALLRAMADVICRRCLDDGPPGRVPAAGGESVAQLCSRVRTVLRTHRDGARLLAAAPLSGSSGALALMERLIELVESDVPARRANVAADTLMAYVTGFVLQEQVAAGTATVPPPGDLAERYPRVLRGLGEDDETAFRTAVRAVVVGFAVVTAVSGEGPTG